MSTVTGDFGHSQHNVVFLVDSEHVVDKDYVTILHPVETVYRVLSAMACLDPVLRMMLHLVTQGSAVQVRFCPELH